MAFRQLAYRIVSSTPNFSSDIRQTRKILSEQSTRLVKFFLCGCREPKIFLRDTFGGNPYEFNPQAEFAATFGRQLIPEIQELLQELYDCMQHRNSSEFAANMQPAFYGNVTFGGNDKLYANNYERYRHYIKNYTKGNVCSVNSARQKDKVKEVNKPSGDMYTHIAKHAATKLAKMGILPFNNFDKGFSRNILYNVASDLKDFVRKNQDCQTRYKSHEEEKSKAWFILSDHAETANKFLKLLEENKYCLREDFQYKWENYFLDALQANEPIHTTYPDFIFDFLKENPSLWEKEDHFSTILEIVSLNDKKYNDYAIQPTYSNNDGIIYGNDILKTDLRQNGNYLQVTLETYPDGINVKMHQVKAHIPSKFRNPVFSSTKLKRSFTVKAEFTDEKLFKDGSNERCTAELKCFVLRSKKSKRKGNTPQNYLYVPLNLPWEDETERKSFMSQDECNKKISAIVKDNDNLMAFFDLGTNELLRPVFAKKSNEISNLYGNPKCEIVDLLWNNSKLIEPKTPFTNAIKRLRNKILEIKSWKTAFNTFERRLSIKNRGLLNKVKEKWIAIEQNETECKRNLTAFYHRLAGDFAKIRKMRLSMDTENYWETTQWIFLCKQVKSLLESKSFEGVLKQRGEKRDYTNKTFRNLIEQIDSTFNNLKVDLRKKIGCHVATQLSKLGITVANFENLRLFQQDARRKRRTNEFLQLWSHRELLKQITSALAERKLKVYDYIDPRYSSQLHPYNNSWMYRHPGSKQVLAEEMQDQKSLNDLCVQHNGKNYKVYDADAVATLNLVRRFYLQTTDDVFLDVVIADGIAIAKKGQTLIADEAAWTLTKKKNVFPAKTKTVRLYKHGERYLEYSQHKKELREIANKFKHLREEMVKKQEIDAKAS